MKSPFECRRYAEQCRAMANGLNQERRRDVLRMADIWEDLARDSENAASREAVAKYWQERRSA
jgi:hypothetical protein